MFEIIMVVNILKLILHRLSKRKHTVLTRTWVSPLAISQWNYSEGNGLFICLCTCLGSVSESRQPARICSLPPESQGSNSSHVEVSSKHLCLLAISSAPKMERAFQNSHRERGKLSTRKITIELSPDFSACTHIPLAIE